MLISRKVLCLWALVIAASIQTLAAIETAPRLVFQDEQGNDHTVEGRAENNEKRLAYYIGEEGQKKFITDTYSIRIEGSNESLIQYAILPDTFKISKTLDDARFNTKSKLKIADITLNNTFRKIWSISNKKSTSLALIWVNENQITLIRIIDYSTHIGSVQFNFPTAEAKHKEVKGYPSIIAFKRGKAIHPSARFMKKSVLSETLVFPNNKKAQYPLLETAIGCGFSQFLRKHIPTVKHIEKYHLNKLLYISAINGRSEIAEFLLNMGADPNAMFFRKSPIHVVGMGTTYVNVSDNAIDHTSRNGHLHTLRTVLNHPKTKIEKSKKEELVLDAMQSGRFNIVDELIASGIKFKPDSRGSAAFARTCLSYNRPEYLSIIDPKTELQSEDFENQINTLLYTSIFHKIAGFASPSTLQYLKDLGIPIDNEDYSGFTPLIRAAGYSNIPAVCWFIENGARVDHRNNRGHTALQYSIIKQQSEATSCLIQQGSDINFPGPKGVTPLMQAVLFRDSETAKSIIEAGGIWDLDSEYLDPCIEYALQQDLDEVFEIAFSQGLSQTRRIHKKWPLKWLAAYYNAKKCQALFESNLKIETTPVDKNQFNIQLASHSAEVTKEILSTKVRPSAVRISCLIDPNGKVRLPVIETKIDRILENEFRKLAASFTFHLNAKNETKKQWLLIEYNLQLTSFKQKFPQDIRILSVQIVTNPPRL